MDNFVLSTFADEIDAKLETQISVLKQCGVKYIEMRGVNGKNLTSHTLAEVKEIKKQLDENGIKISAVGSPIGKIKITESFESHLELFLHTIQIAHILETKYIRIFSFFIPDGQEPESFRDEVMSRMRKLVEVAENEGITLLHENEKDIYGDTAARCLDILKTVNSSALRATFDPANFVQCGEKVFPEGYELLKGYIEYVHIKDALYSDKSVVPSGKGDGKIGELLKALIKTGYKGFLSLEPHLASFEGFNELEKNALKKDSGKGEGEKKFLIALEALKGILAEI